LDKIYVTGHRNPDTDSIVAAIAYAVMHNAMGDQEYVAARLGHLSDETKAILNRFGFEPPVYITDVRTQVQDLEYDVPPILNHAVTINHVWSAMQTGRRTSIPITDDFGALLGMMTPGDVAEYDMRTISNPVLENVPVFNILSVLEGQLMGETRSVVNTISGRVVIAQPKGTEQELFSNENTILLCGSQPQFIRQAVEAGVHCVIICQAELPEEVRSIVSDTVIITTPYDTYKTSRLIFQAPSAGTICRRKELHYFYEDDYLDDVRAIMANSRFRSYPVLSREDNKVIGTLSRFHMIEPRRKRVVLVDHNEFAQSVPGLEQADIVAIIDHHRLADIQTKAPIYFRNEPVGSTTTIVAGMFQERGLMPSKRLAGLMAAAIVSDTVMFKSPTCTQRDRIMAERMASFAGLSLEKMGHDIFAAASSTEKSVEELMGMDFKEFHIAGHDFGISQITCVDSDRHLERKAEFLAHMEKMRKQRRYSMMLLMITDVLKEGSKLLYIGDEDHFEHAFRVKLKDNEAFLPGVLSRKKQVVPMLSALWG